MKKRVWLFSFIVLSLLLSSASIATAQLGPDDVQLLFNKQVYDRDEVVEMLVNVSGGVALPVRFAVEVWSPTMSLVWFHEETLTAYNNIIAFKLPGVPDGTYTVYYALEGMVPQVATFMVKKPTFDIIAVSPTSLFAVVGNSVVISVAVNNTGADGTMELRVLDENGTIVASSGPVSLVYSELYGTNLVFIVPNTPGTYTYTVVTYNVKYNVIDDLEQIIVTVTPPVPAPAPAPPYVPPPPPAPPTPPPPVTPPVTVTLPANLTTPIPGAIKSYIANISGYVDETCTVTIPLVITTPEGIMIKLQRGTRISPVCVSIEIHILAEPPLSTTEQMVVGVSADLRLTGLEFTPPALVRFPYNPEMVPQGYAVMLAYFDAAANEWKPVPTVSVNMVEGYIEGLVEHFTPYAPVAYRQVTPVPITVTTTVTAIEEVTLTETVETTVVETAVETETVHVTEILTERETVVETETVTETQLTTATVRETVVRTTTLPTLLTHTVTETATETTTVEITKVPWGAYLAIVLAIVFAIALAATATFMRRRT